MRLHTLSALSRDVLHRLTFSERLETTAIDVGVVDEEVFAAIVRNDESKSLLIVEPFHCTLCHNVLLGS